MEDAARVLIVDDEEPNRRLLARLVVSQKFVPVIATGGREALDIVAREHVDVVLLDWMMPSVDGLTVLSKLSADPVTARIPVIVVSALDDRETRLKALSNGAVDFINKPYDSVEISTRVRNCVRLKRAMDEVEAQRDRLRSLVAEQTDQWSALIASVPDYILRVDRNGRVEFLNRGVPPRSVFEAFGSDWSEIFAESTERETLRVALASVIDESRVVVVDSTKLDSNGQGIAYRCHLAPIRRGAANSGAVIVVSDVSALRRAHDRDRSHAEQMRFLAKTAVAFLQVELDEDFFALVTSELAALVGDDVGFVVGECEDGRIEIRAKFGLRDIERLVTAVVESNPPSLRDAIHRAKWTLLEGTLDALLCHPDDSELPRKKQAYVLGFKKHMELVGCALFLVDEGHAPPNAAMIEAFLNQAAVALDQRRAARRLRETERQLSQSTKMEAIGKLAGGIAHDFNNLLTSITSFTMFVHSTLPEGDARRDDLAVVLRSTERASGLTRQLLAFSRQEKVAARAFDLREALSHVTKLLVRTLGEHIRVEVTVPDELVVVLADPNQIDQIVMNLAVNARDAMVDGGTLRMSVAKENVRASSNELRVGNYAKLVVSDSGCGMDAATKARIFEPFFTTKEVGRGTGLGLSTCFGIVKQLGGQIQVDSEIGVGTSFRIYIPLHEGSLDEAAAAEDTLASGHGEMILVVEDEEQLRIVETRTLKSAGYTVIEAKDGDEGCEMLDKYGSKIELVFTDCVMPGKSGFRVLEHALKVAPHAGMLMTSGYLPDQVLREHSLVKVPPVLWKPFTPSALLRQVSKALAARSTGDTSANESSTEKADTTESSLDVQEDSSKSNLRILLIEDEVDVRRAMERFLGTQSYDVVTAGTIADARAAIEREEVIDAVLCDLSLPDGSGASLYKWVEETKPELASRILLLTGGATDPEAVALVRKIRERVLSKPIDPRKIIAAITRVSKSAKKV